MVFYYHYEKEIDKARVVVIDGPTKITEHLVNKVVCHVSTTTEKAEHHPKFKVLGVCKRIEIFEDTIYIN